MNMNKLGWMVGTALLFNFAGFAITKGYDMNNGLLGIIIALGLDLIAYWMMDNYAKS